MQWHYYIFAAIVLLIFGVQQTLIYRHYKRLLSANHEEGERYYLISSLSVVMTAVVIITLWNGWFFVQNRETQTKQGLRAILDGIAPMQAYELKKAGHALVTLDTADDNPHYLSLIKTTVEWMKLNPQIASIYTFRKTGDGRVVFILGPETDYNHDGIIEGENETRIPIGTEYTSVDAEMEEAFRGHYSFEEAPTEDAWGSAISAFMPIYGEYPNKPEAILGVDFNGTEWNAAILQERLDSINLLAGFLILVNACYLVACYSWADRMQIRRHKFEKELAHLDRLNLIGEMAASIAHEIRNPLTTVRGFLQIMERDESDPKRCSRYKLMIEELDRANEIITLYLSLAKNKTLDLRRNNLNHILQTLLPLLQASSLEKGHELVFNPGETIDLLFDTKEIHQLILNLVRNALEAMPKKGVVTIKTHSENNSVILAIQDQGTGIDPEVIEKLGTPFVTTKANGTGLGLAVCYRIAQRHGGTIDFHTRPDGTTVIVRFTQK